MQKTFIYLYIQTMKKLIIILLILVGSYGFSQNPGLITDDMTYDQFKQDFMDMQTTSSFDILKIEVQDNIKAENKHVIYGAIAFTTILTVSHFSENEMFTKEAYYISIGLIITGTAIFVATNKQTKFNKRRTKR